MEQLKIRTRYQRERFALTLAEQLKRSSDPQTAAVGECITYVLGAPIQLVHDAICKLLRAHPDLQSALELELIEPPARLEFPDYEVADAGLEEVETEQ